MSHPYKLIRSRRRSIALMISSDATLVVRAPIFVSRFHIENLIERKKDWISKHLERKRQVKTGAKKELLFLGELNPMAFESREKMVAWYRKQAREILTQRMEHWSKLSGWQFKSMSINGARTRWGSCGPKNSINFSWRLVMAPMHVVDYVVVHELAHTVVKNHSRKFWEAVAGVMPDYKERRKWLRENEGRFAS
ncbi:MAG: SprT family zinc-dependent metalloprotease [Patescibacteria group bacterium]|mgnify:FL=1